MREINYEDILSNKYNTSFTEDKSELEAILSHVRGLENLKILARAGCGKSTSTCKFIADNPDKKFLYLVFNKSMKLEADHTMKHLPNVEISTLHSYIYRKLDIRDKYAICKADYSVFDIGKLCNIFAKSKEDFELLNTIKDMIDAFLMTKHKVEEYLETVICDSYTKSLFAKAVKGLMTKKELTTHATYLKKFQLGRGKIDFYDYVVVDESQDINPCMMDIVMRKTDKKSKIILLGDAKQSIYSFMGSVPALLKGVKFPTLPLTRSFRIGETTAKVCNLIFDKMSGGFDKLGISGVNPNQKIVRHINKLEPHSVIARKNYTLLEYAIVNMNNFDEIYIKNFSVSSIKQVLDFYVKGISSNPRFGRKSFNEYKKKCLLDEDFISLSETKLCEDYGSELYAILDTLEGKMVSRKTEKGLNLFTSHSSKGMTIQGNLLMLNDFLPLQETYDKYILGELEYEEFEEEINILYVAITRSGDKIQLNENILKFVCYNFVS